MRAGETCGGVEERRAEPTGAASSESPTGGERWGEGVRGGGREQKGKHRKRRAEESGGQIEKRA